MKKMGFQAMNTEDSKRPGGRAVVFIYGYDGFALDQVTALINQSTIDEWIYIDEQRAQEHIESLIASVHNNEGVVWKREDEKVILFSGISEKEVHEVVPALMGLQDNKPLIAMTTPVSVKWTFKQLVNELTQEREAIARGR